MSAAIGNTVPKDLADDGKYQLFVELLCDPNEVERTNEQVAELIGISTTTIYRWKKRVDWEYIKAERRKRFAARITQVDDAMFKKAIKGDVSAADLLYQRFDAWTPTTKNLTEHSVSDAEVDEALNALIERKRSAVAAMDATGREGDAVPDGAQAAEAEGGAVEVLPAQPGATEVHPGGGA